MFGVKKAIASTMFHYTTKNYKFVCAQCYDLLTFRIDHTSTMSSALGIRHYYVMSLGPCGRSV